jgi:NAD(P)-dependent dehydrogenase (short-subunit alcohol dehydrogenase family)
VSTDTSSKRRRHVIVTGAASGIGRATAALLLDDGATVTAVDLAPEVEELADRGARVLVADVTDLDVRHELASTTEAMHGLVNAAGIIKVGELADFDLEDWMRIFKVNVEAPFFLTQALLPRMERGCSIVNVASMAAKVPDDAAAAYSASKAALASITRSFAMRLGRDGIRVNSVSPGIILTRMQDDFLGFYARRAGLSADVFQERRLQEVPIGRGGAPEEVAEVIRFLLSDRASYITGEDVNITGGLVMW